MHRLSVDERTQHVLDGMRSGAQRGYIGEPVSQLEHALQCAARAQQAGAAAHEVLAALFHDIGHLIAPAGSPEMAGLGICDHEAIGARWLRGLGIGDDVCELVASHVQAKRYLACRRTGYFEQLSEASRGTLAFQGGPMTPEQAQSFENDPGFAAKLRLRIWDEAAKEPGRQVPDLISYAEMIRRSLEESR